MGFVIILVFYLLELQDWVAAVSGRILCSNLVAQIVPIPI